MQSKSMHVYAGKSIPVIAATLSEDPSNRRAILHSIVRPGEFIPGEGNFSFITIDDTVDLERRLQLSALDNYPDATVVLDIQGDKFTGLLVLGYISTSYHFVENIDGKIWATVRRSKVLPCGAKRQVCP